MFVCRSCGEKKKSQPAREGTELVTGMYTNLMRVLIPENTTFLEKKVYCQTAKSLLDLTFSAKDSEYSLSQDLSGD